MEIVIFLLTEHPVAGPIKLLLILQAAQPPTGLGRPTVNGSEYATSAGEYPSIKKVKQGIKTTHKNPKRKESHCHFQVPTSEAKLPGQSSVCARSRR